MEWIAANFTDLTWAKLVVWAIREGRQAARAVDEFLMGSSDLPR